MTGDNFVSRSAVHLNCPLLSKCGKTNFSQFLSKITVLFYLPLLQFQFTHLLALLKICNDTSRKLSSFFKFSSCPLNSDSFATTLLIFSSLSRSHNLFEYCYKICCYILSKQRHLKPFVYKLVQNKHENLLDNFFKFD